jgi:hypothetical protein
MEQGTKEPQSDFFGVIIHSEKLSLRQNSEYLQNVTAGNGPFSPRGVDVSRREQDMSQLERRCVESYDSGHRATQLAVLRIEGTRTPDVNNVIEYFSEQRATVLPEKFAEPTECDRRGGVYIVPIQIMVKKSSMSRLFQGCVDSHSISSHSSRMSVSRPSEQNAPSATNSMVALSGDLGPEKDSQCEAEQIVRQNRPNQQTR